MMMSFEKIYRMRVYNKHRTDVLRKKDPKSWYAFMKINVDFVLYRGKIISLIHLAIANMIETLFTNIFFSALINVIVGLILIAYNCGLIEKYLSVS